MLSTEILLLVVVAVFVIEKLSLVVVAVFDKIRINLGIKCITLQLSFAPYGFQFKSNNSSNSMNTYCVSRSNERTVKY
ncbi:unnamed protein product [Schistosoma mattheei]|uniref:Uncharacterized protein n=1 Tax=Schistosoma mattheei TaxID=31246 RepID=A0A3P8EXY3_9TREM|nr:unnamed protein product [Schistosoma mattheei]